MKNTIIIASRESQLALWQSRYVQGLIQKQTGQDCQILTMKTKGDIILDKPLNKVGGKALFMKELEIAIEQGQAHLAVHSLKDVPYELPDGFVLAGFFTRENPYDAFVSNHYQQLDDLPKASVIGTSSLRRKAQILAHRPDLIVKDLRGNVNTRLKKLDQGEYDAVILAAAGLIRLGLDKRIQQVLPKEICLPAVGQGIVVAEVFAQNDPLRQLLNGLNNPNSLACAMAERSFNEALQGGCHAPIAAFAEKDSEGILHLEAMVATSNGQRVLRQSLRGSDPVKLGKALADQMIQKGAKDILQDIV
ncbi:hydroxymethylbilane synthase [Facilibium subflavum]|uniref:hydroxymethylbilane synthase n=1 Tax=Facilibium subflavum TaxID=2219058 RepID=UPI000E651821|nr:hydroxymethylbilane synthase [Facilibium subflavum]